MAQNAMPTVPPLAPFLCCVLLYYFSACWASLPPKYRPRLLRPRPVPSTGASLLPATTRPSTGSTGAIAGAKKVFLECSSTGPRRGTTRLFPQNRRVGAARSSRDSRARFAATGCFCFRSSRFFCGPGTLFGQVPQASPGKPCRARPAGDADFW